MCSCICTNWVCNFYLVCAHLVQVYFWGRASSLLGSQLVCQLLCQFVDQPWNSWLELEGCGNLKPHMDYDRIYKFQLNIYKFSERFWQVVTLPQNMFLQRYFRYKISPWNCSGFAGASAWSMAVVNHDAWLMGDIHDVLKCYPVAAHNLVVFWSFTEAQTTNTAIWLYLHIYIYIYIYIINMYVHIYLTYACILYTFVTFVYVHV